MVEEPKMRIQNDMHRPEVNNLMRSKANPDYNPLVEESAENEFNQDQSTATMYRTTPAHFSPHIPSQKYPGKKNKNL